MEQFDPAKLSAHDKAAMQLAIKQVAAESEAARQEIDDRLHTRPWREVAEDVVWRCQDRHLKLRPWDCPPCRTRDRSEERRVGKEC